MYQKLYKYLQTKYKESDFKIVLDGELHTGKIFSKVSLSFQTLLGIHELFPIVAVFYTSLTSRPFQLGYKIGVEIINV